MRLLGLAIGLARTLVIRANALTFPQNGDRRFDVMRKGKDIGDHRYRFSGAPDAFTLKISTDVEVKVPLIRMTAHKFKHASTKLWKGGKLQQFSSGTVDDGEPHQLRTANKGVLPASLWNDDIRGCWASRCAMSSAIRPDWQRS